MQVGAEPTESDIVIANVFARLGSDVEFIAASKGYMVRTPDITMNGLAWEIKCIESGKIDKVRQNINAALGQSQNVIIGTFRTPIMDDKIMRFISKYLDNDRHRKSVKRLLVVTKTHQVLDLK